MIGNKRTLTDTTVDATSLEVTTLVVEVRDEDEETRTVAIVVVAEAAEVVVEVASTIDLWMMLSPGTSKAVMVLRLIMMIPASKRRATTRPSQPLPVPARATLVVETNMRPEALQFLKVDLAVATGATILPTFKTTTRSCSVIDQVRFVWVERG